MTPFREQIACLPGGDLILAGIKDIKMGKTTNQSYLVMSYFLLNQKPATTAHRVEGRNPAL